MKSSSRVKGPPVIEPVRCSGSEPSSSEKKKVLNAIISTDCWMVSWQTTQANGFNGNLLHLCATLSDDQIRNSSHASSHHGDEPCTHH